MFEGETLTVALDGIIKETARLAFTPAVLIGGVNFMKRGVFASHRKIIKKLTDFRALVQGLIEERKNTIKLSGVSQNDKSTRKDLLQLLLEKQIQGDEDAFTDADIINEFMTFFVAGMDTTAHLISMTTYYLSQNPNIKNQVLKEIEELYVPLGSNVTIDALNKMKYLGNVMNETLRMTPPATGLFLREAVVDHKLLDVNIQKGTLINIEFLGTNFNPQVYEEPE